jgi:hypothetical protein
MSVSWCQTFLPLAKPASIVFSSALLVAVAVDVSVPDVGAAVTGRVGSSGAVIGLQHILHRIRISADVFWYSWPK